MPPLRQIERIDDGGDAVWVSSPALRGLLGSTVRAARSLLFEAANTSAVTTAHGQPGHVCYEVFPWQRGYWSAGAHSGPHDCPDGGCAR